MPLLIAPPAGSKNTSEKAGRQSRSGYAAADWPTRLALGVAGETRRSKIEDRKTKTEYEYENEQEHDHE